MRACTIALFLAGLTFGFGGTLSALAQSAPTPPPAGRLDQRDPGTGPICWEHLTPSMAQTDSLFQLLGFGVGPIAVFQLLDVVFGEVIQRRRRASGSRSLRLAQLSL